MSAFQNGSLSLTRDEEFVTESSVWHFRADGLYCRSPRIGGVRQQRCAGSLENGVWMRFREVWLIDDGKGSNRLLLVLPGGGYVKTGRVLSSTIPEA